MRGRAARVAVAALAPLAAGWLASGSCHVSGCYEDCDPCWQQCTCRTVCHNPLQDGAAYRIAACSRRVLADGPGRTRIQLGEIAGPALELALGPGPHDAADMARFARGVLEHNDALLPRRAGTAWNLAALDPFEGATLVTFHAGARAVGEAFQANSITLLFDRRGRLVEVDQVLLRGLP